MLGLGSILFSGYSQNLILNPSFEQYDSCTNYVGNIDVVQNWGNGNIITPDYYNTCNSFPVGIPSNYLGYQVAQDGQGYVGIGLVNPINARESFQGKLSEPLESNIYYCFEMYISIADSVAFAIDEIGIYFSPDTIIPTDFTLNNNSLPYQMHLDVSAFSDTSNWHLVTGGYQATGSEGYFLVSFFSTNLTWTKLSNVSDDSVTYYYFDNFNLYKCSPPTVVIPDVFTPNNDGINDLFYITYLPEGSILKIYNRWGNIVYENGSYHNDWDGTMGAGQKVSDGTYFYFLQTPDGKKYSSTLNVFDSRP